MSNLSNYGSHGAMTRNSDTSLNTMYFIPDTLTLSNIKNNIDVSSIDDVLYLRDKLIDSLGVPKAALQSSSDSSSPSDFRTKPLDEIDTFSANRIPYIQDSFLSGWEKLITLLSYYFGADLDTLKVSVMIKSPSKISSKVAKEYSDGFELVRNTIAMYRETDADYSPTFADLQQLLLNFNLNPEILMVPGFIKRNKGNIVDIDPLMLGEPSQDGFGDVANIGTEPSDNNPSSQQSESLLTKKYSVQYLKESLPKNVNYSIEIADGELVHQRLYNCFVHR